MIIYLCGLLWKKYFDCIIILVIYHNQHTCIDKTLQWKKKINKSNKQKATTKNKNNKQLVGCYCFIKISDF